MARTYFPASVASLLRLQELAKDGAATIGQLRSILGEFHGRFIDENAASLVFMIEPADRELVQNTQPFGAEVAQNFPSASYDVEEAAKCLALDRGTASAFHLMRIIELALRVFYGSLGLAAPNNPNWEKLLSPLRIESNKPPNQRSAQWRADETFNARAFERLQGVRDAWRNPTMHIESKYTTEEARDIYDHVARLMRELAVKLHE